MERRDFLKVAALVSLSPSFVKSFIPQEDHRKWFLKNRDWLQDWILKADRDYVLDPDYYRHEKYWTTQRFITRKGLSCTSVVFKTSKTIEDAKEYIEIEAIRQHIFDIAYAVVFGKRNNKIRTFDGFLAQKGRLPVKSDKLELYVLGERDPRNFKYGTKIFLNKFWKPQEDSLVFNIMSEFGVYAA